MRKADHRGCDVAIFLLGFALLSCSTPTLRFVHADPNVETPRSPLKPQADAISIPPEVGYVVETSDASPSTESAPLVIHIQEAHANYEAQKNLVTILEQLIRQRGLKLILVEGGSGNVGLSHLRRLGDAAKRTAVADKYLKLGLISAEEYLDIASDDDLVLWGIEEPTLYQRNVEAFLEAQSVREAVTPSLSSVREAIETLTPKVLDPALTDLERRVTAFQEDRVGLGEYADALTEQARRAGVTLDPYGNLQRFQEVRELERSFHQELVARQQQILLVRLRFREQRAATEQLLADAKRSGRMAPEEFYGRLKRLVEEANLSLGEYPELARYCRYVEERPQIDSTELAKELDRVAEAVRQRLLATPQAKRLHDAARQQELLTRLVGLNLSPDEYAQWTALKPGVTALASTLNELLTASGLPTRSFDGLNQLTSAIPSLQRFYEVAGQRDAAMVARVMEKLRDSHEPMAVLITGGFHGPAILELLKAQGVRVVVVAPKVTVPTDEQLYRAVLRFKHGQGTMEEVERAAGAHQEVGEAAAPPSTVPPPKSPERAQ